MKASLSRTLVASLFLCVIPLHTQAEKSAEPEDSTAIFVSAALLGHITAFLGTKIAEKTINGRAVNEYAKDVQMSMVNSTLDLPYGVAAQRAILPLLGAGFERVVEGFGIKTPTIENVVSTKKTGDVTTHTVKNIKDPSAFDIEGAYRAGTAFYKYEKSIKRVSKIFKNNKLAVAELPGKVPSLIRENMQESLAISPALFACGWARSMAGKLVLEKVSKGVSAFFNDNKTLGYTVGIPAAVLSSSFLEMLFFEIAKKINIEKTMLRADVFNLGTDLHTAYAEYAKQREGKTVAYKNQCAYLITAICLAPFVEEFYTDLTSGFEKEFSSSATPIGYVYTSMRNGTSAILKSENYTLAYEIIRSKLAKQEAARQEVLNVPTEETIVSTDTVMASPKNDTVVTTPSIISHVEEQAPVVLTLDDSNIQVPRAHYEPVVEAELTTTIENNTDFIA